MSKPHGSGWPDSDEGPVFYWQDGCSCEVCREQRDMALAYSNWTTQRLGECIRKAAARSDDASLDYLLDGAREMLSVWHTTPDGQELVRH